MKFESIKDKDEFIKKNLKLVVSRVKKLNNGNFDSDLFQAGSLALVMAVNRFDVNMRNKFSTYAVYCIDGEILKHKRYNSVIRPVIRKNGKVIQYVDILSLDMPTDDEGACLGDSISGHDNPEQNVVSDIFVEWFLDGLSDRERKVIELRLKGLTQKNISLATYIKQPQVSIMIKRIGEKYLKCINS